MPCCEKTLKVESEVSVIRSRRSQVQREESGHWVEASLCSSGKDIDSCNAGRL